MDELSPRMAFIALGIGAVAFTAIKIVWGVSQWGRKTDYRVGESWGDEPVEVTEWSGDAGYVSAGGELWRAMSKDALRPGDKVVVSKSKGLLLEVRKV